MASSKIHDYVDTLIGELRYVDDEGTLIVAIDKIFASFSYRSLSESLIHEVEKALDKKLAKIITVITVRYMSNMTAQEKTVFHDKLVLACEEEVYWSEEHMPIVDDVPMGTYLYHHPEALWYYAMSHLGGLTVSAIIEKYYADETLLK